MADDLDLGGLEALAMAATPGDLDTVPNPPDEYGGHSTGWYECPVCGGQGEVEGAEYCNFDGVALGVQFFGIGNDHKNYEAYFRAANPATMLALITRLRASDAATAAAVERAVWQDISTAPRDGTEIILRRGDRVGAAHWYEWTKTESEYHSNGTYLGEYSYDGGEGWSVGLDGDGWDDEKAPTHWQPLPAPPALPSTPPVAEEA